MSRRRFNPEDFKTQSEAIRYLTENFENIHTAKEAREYIRAHLPKESYYQTKIMERIRTLISTAFVWKAAAGPYTRQGIPDICAVIGGRYYGFEVKRPLIGRPSEIQKMTIRKIEEAGGRAYIVCTPDEVEKILAKNGEI